MRKGLAIADRHYCSAHLSLVAARDVIAAPAYTRRLIHAVSDIVRRAVAVNRIALAAIGQCNGSRMDNERAG